MPAVQGFHARPPGSVTIATMPVMAEKPAPADRVTVTVPADPSFASVLRAAAASVAARLDLPIDDLEDLRLAVDEAFAALITRGGSATTITLHLTPVVEGVDALLTTDGEGNAWPPTSGDLAVQVLTALADEIRFDRVDGRPAVVIVKRTGRG